MARKAGRGGTKPFPGLGGGSKGAPRTTRAKRSSGRESPALAGGSAGYKRGGSRRSSGAGRGGHQPMPGIAGGTAGGFKKQGGVRARVGPAPTGR